MTRPNFIYYQVDCSGSVMNEFFTNSLESAIAHFISISKGFENWGVELDLPISLYSYADVLR